MKKLICVLLVLFMLTSMLCTFSYAYSKNTYAERSVYLEATEYLNMLKLGIDTGKTAYVTRGRAVTSIIKAMGLYDTALKLSEYTLDEHKAAYLAYQSGILASSQPSGWMLEDNVTLAQAAKMFVVALGYNASVPPENAYPAAYIAKASNLGLLKHVNTDDINSPLSYENFTIMLSCALQTSVLEIAGIYGDGVTYKQSENTTLESIYLDMKGWKIGEAIVSGDATGSIYPQSTPEKDRIVIDGVSYINTNPAYNGFVGYRVKYVVTDTSAKNSELTGMMPVSENTVIKLSSFDDPYLKEGAIYYTVPGNTYKEEKINLSTGVIVTVNGILSSNFSLSDINLNEGDFEFIDNDGDTKFDIIKCNYAKSCIVNFVKDDAIYIKNGLINSKSVIDLSDPQLVSYDISDTEGNKLTLGDIKEDDGITVIASQDFSYIKIIKLKDPVNIKITEASDDMVMANDTWYKIGDISLSLVPGQVYTVRINENNVIFYATQEYHGFVYVMDAGRNQGGIDKSTLLKVYDIKTGINTYTAASKVSIDGNTYTGNEEICSAIPKSTLINLDTNSNGEFTKITSLEKYGEKATRVYCKYARAFNDTVNADSVPFRFDDNTVFFTVPENGDDNDYGVDVEFKDNYEYTTQAYEFDDETGAVKAAVIIVQTDMKTNLTYKADVAIISSVSQVALSDGEATYKVTGFDDGKEFNYTAGQYDDVFRVCSSLKAGDVVRYIVNYSDEIVAIERIAELSKATSGYNNGKNTADEQIFGQALSIDKDVITNNSKYLYHRLGMSTNLSFNNISSMEFFAHVENTVDPESQFADYYIFDKRTKTVSLASIHDIITYEMAGEGASWIFVQKSYTDVQCIVIVK